MARTSSGFCRAREGSKHPDLVSTGWFAKLSGPFGHHPVQMEGVLTSGEYVYFNAREGRVLLEVYPTREDLAVEERLLARYRRRVPHDAGSLSAGDCVRHIKQLLGQYLAG